MNVIEMVKERLARYPGVEFEANENSIEVRPADDTGFAVGIESSRSGYSVHFAGWHEEFDSQEEALECFAFGLSDSCRLRVTYRGSTPVRWVVESLKDGEWIPDSETGLILIPFWRPTRTAYLQNSLLPPPNDSAGAADATRRSAPGAAADPQSRYPHASQE
jgi:hypothetical protein